MGDCWTPMENMGKKINADMITHENSAEETANMHAAFNKNIAK